MSFKVTSPLVAIAPVSDQQALDDANQGPRYFYEGAVIPDGFNDERCEQLVEDGMLEKASATDSEAGSSDGPPAKSASKAEWVDYAVSQGESEEVANASTKDELVEKYA